MLEKALGSVQGVVFDLDDTLFDEADWIISAMQAAAEAIRLDPGRVLALAEKFITMHGHASDDIYNFILLGCGQSDSARNIAAMSAAIKRFRPHAGSMSLYAGAREALIELGRNHKLGLILHGDAAMQRGKVAALGLDLLIPHIICSNELPGAPIRWPDPRPLHSMRLEMLLPPEQMLFVADNPFRDFLIARRAGMLTCRTLTGLYRDTAYPSPEHAAHYTVTSVSHLPELLSGAQTQTGLIMQSLDFLRKRDEARG